MISSMHGVNAVNSSVMYTELTLLYTRTTDPDYLSVSNAIQDLIWKFEESKQLETEWNRLDLSVQIDLVPKVRYFSVDFILNYIELLSLIGFPSLPTIKRWNDSSLSRFAMIVSKETEIDVVNEPISKEFARTFLSATSETPSWDRVNVIHLMRAIFGQQVMLECVDRMASEVLNKSFFDLIPVMKDWENLKKLPLEWSMNLTSDMYSASE